MYRWIRNLHLFLGVFSFLFLLMYGVSAVQMSHNRWFDLKPKVTETSTALPAGIASPRDAATQIMQAGDLRGELNQVRTTPGGYAFQIARPGMAYQVQYETSTGAVKIRANEARFMGALNRIHHIGGMWHQTALFNIWGLFTGLVSVALIGLACSGIYMWYKLRMDRIAGMVLLAISIGGGITLLTLMRMA